MTRPPWRQLAIEDAVDDPAERRDIRQSYDPDYSEDPWHESADDAPDDPSDPDGF